MSVTSSAQLIDGTIVRETFRIRAFPSELTNVGLTAVGLPLRLLALLDLADLAQECLLKSVNPISRHVTNVRLGVFRSLLRLEYTSVLGQLRD